MIKKENINSSSNNILNPISIYYEFLFYSHGFSKYFLQIDKC